MQKPITTLIFALSFCTNPNSYEQLPSLVIVSNTFYPDLGAAPSRLWHLANALAQRGWALKVITAVSPQHYRPEQEISSEFPIQYYPYRAYKGKRSVSRLLSMGKVALVLASYFWRSARKQTPDFVLVQCPPLALPLIATFLNRFLRTKILLTVSDLWPQAIRDVGLLKATSWQYRLLQKQMDWLYRKVDGCLVQSGEVQNYLASIGQQRTVLYRTGVSLAEFPPPASYQQPPETQKLRLTFAGMIGIAQGLLAVCEQIRFADFQLELHIFGEGIEKEALQRLSEQGNREDLHIHEIVPVEAIPALLGGFDAAFIPQKNNIEGTLPSKLYEAMAAAIPIIYLGRGEGAAIVNGAGCGWAVPANDPTQLKKVLSKFAQTSFSQRKEMGQNGRKYAENHLERKLQIERLIPFLASYD